MTSAEIKRLAQILRSRRVVVLAGGCSAEREISLLSGASIEVTLRRAGIAADVVDPGTDESEAFRVIDELRSSRPLVFVALHGAFGEDGRIQQRLERNKVAFTGSASDASRIAFEKSRLKTRWVAEGVRTAPFAVIGHDFVDRLDLDSIWRQFGGKALVVKPTASGSSLGVGRVDRFSDFAPRIHDALRFGCEVMVEPFLAGPEWSVGFYDSDCIGVNRITTDETAGLFDYTRKYSSVASPFEPMSPSASGIPVGLIPLAKDAVRSAGARGMSRVDVREDSSGQMFVLEINTVPGFSAKSQYPRMAETSGIGFESLCIRALGDCILGH
ncbi:D-alanine--D-alanine ligase family protein [Stratiformator vulcanicus]|uniref:D-alanine--D-alanine ligase n=1 Tax=Stratiformator vulcanicus TaxID=2527980 RepID=A0A517R0E9_9PLAN|nr:hypothetical protein [Stratiformator vulcanicus]QDT37372.1 D-alanine--D-alanine ligase Ddl [Stratiformator vulcanicus]